MPDSELAVVSVDSFPAPTIITRAGPTTRKKFFEFFTVPIRNANTRAASYRAIQQFLAWVERAGYQDLEDIEPITVAAYIETLQRQAAPPTVKQHMAAIRMLFSWLTEKGSRSADSRPRRQPHDETLRPPGPEGVARGHGADSVLTPSILADTQRFITADQKFHMKGPQDSRGKKANPRARIGQLGVNLIEKNRPTRP
jgi:hypothetical protein